MSKVKVSMLEPQNNSIRTIDTTGSKTIAKPIVSSRAVMGEGYYRLNETKRILYWDGEKWMKPVKDQQGRLGTWLGQLDKQPKVKSAEYIPDVDRVVG